jgi:transposase-like protein
VDQEGNGGDRGVRAAGMKPRRDPSKERLWRQAVAEQRRSGQTVRAYCAQHGFSEPSFYAWRSELARRAKERKAAARLGQRNGLGATSPEAKSPTPFLSLKLAEDAELPSANHCLRAIELVLPAGTRLRIPSGCDPATLKMVLAALQDHPC